MFCLEESLWTNYKEPAIQPTVFIYNFRSPIRVWDVLTVRFQRIEPKLEKMEFTLLIYSKSIFLHPINKT